MYDRIMAEVQRYEAMAKEKDEARAKMLPARLKMYLVSNGITQEALAQELGVSRMEVFRWLRGEYVPRAEVMQKLEEKKIVDKITKN